MIEKKNKITVEEMYQKAIDEFLFEINQIEDYPAENYVRDIDNFLFDYFHTPHANDD